MNQTQKFWNRLSKYYDKETKQFDWLNTKVIDKIIKYLRNDDIVLECGCGTGTIAVEIANNVKEIYAFDISSGMIDLAKEKAEKRKIDNIDFSQTDIFNEKFKNESYEVLLTFNVLHFVEEKKKVVRRINDLLKPGGLFISVTPCSGEKKFSFKYIFEAGKMLMFLLTKIKMIPFKTFSVVSGFNITKLKDLISSENFQFVETENMHGPEIHYFIVAKKI